MKFLKYLLILLASLFVLSLVLFFILTRPGVQRAYLEGKLPEGSTLGYFQATPTGLELSDLSVKFEEGGFVKIKRMETKFSLWQALFHKTLSLGTVEIDGFVADLPNVSQSESKQEPKTAEPSSTPSETQGDFLKMLYALGESEWIIEVDRININGQITAASVGEMIFKMESGSIGAGVQSEVAMHFGFTAEAVNASGLRSVAAEMILAFDQKASGGFESLGFQSTVTGKDGAEALLLSFEQSADIQIQSEAQTASVLSQFLFSLPKPSLLSAELESFDSIQANGAFALSSAGKTAEISELSFDTVVNGQPMVRLQLLQPFKTGTNTFQGDLVSLVVTALPMELISRFLGEGYQLSGAPFSMQMTLSGQEDGSYRFASRELLVLGPIDLAGPDGDLLQALSARLQPDLLLYPSGEVDFDLGKIQVSQKGVEIASANISGQLPSDSNEAPLKALQIVSSAKLSLNPLFRQPALVRSGIIRSGQVDITAKYDGPAEYPLKADVILSNLVNPQTGKPLPQYRIESRVWPMDTDELQLSSQLSVGSVSSPSSALLLEAEANPKKSPIPFTFKITSDQLLQSDFMALAGVYEAVATPASTQTPDQPGSASEDVSPPWSSLDGTGSIELKYIVLEPNLVVTDLKANVVVSEPLLGLENFSAQLGGGSVAGSGSVQYLVNTEPAYTVKSAFDLKSIDSAKLSSTQAKPLPIQGQIDGRFSVAGSGPTLESAINDLEGGMEMHMRDGVLTAFELDDRAQVGLGILGLLGQSMERPGVTAMAKTVPYFKDIRFESFDFALNRASDKKIKVTQMKLLGESLYIQGIGFVAATNLSEVMDQPLDLQLSLGARGPLVNALETLNLLKPTSNDAGYRQWTQKINIGGTLANPNTEALMALLKNAAGKALNPTTPPVTPPASKAPEANTTTTPPATPPAKAPTKAQKHRDELEMGLDLLNTVLGGQ